MDASLPRLRFLLFCGGVRYIRAGLRLGYWQGNPATGADGGLRGIECFAPLTAEALWQGTAATAAKPAAGGIGRLTGRTGDA